MSDLKHNLYLEERPNQTGGPEAAVFAGEQENSAYPGDAGAGKEVAAFSTWKINLRLARRLNNRLRRL